MIRGVVSIDPSANHGYRVTSMLECDLMSDRIHPRCSTTDNSYPSMYHIRNYFFEYFFRVGSIFSRTNNSYEWNIGS